MKDPKPLPSGDPVRFATSDVDDAVWPVKTSNPRKFEVNYRATDGTSVGNNPGRQFLANRGSGTRYHVGIDLFAEHRDKVVACEDGRIVSFYTFYTVRSTGEVSYSLIIEHEDFVINYGEVKENAQGEFGWRVGDRVRRGQEIARVSTTGMLHFETYIRGTAHNHRWMVGRARPNGLLNPTLYLLKLAAAAQGIGGPGGGGESTERPLKHPRLAGNDALQAAARGERSFMSGRDNGEHVGLVQDALDLILPEADRINAGVNRGTFGPLTETAVRKFQQRAGLTAEGLVGKNTLLALDAALPALGGSSTFVRAAALTDPRRVEYFDGNNCRQTKTGGSRSWRNNNPGNIVCGQFTNTHGAIGCDDNTQPTAAIFPSLEVGRAAQVALLRTENYQRLTVGGAMDRWTGQADNTSYRACIRQRSGISMDRQMESLSHEDLVSLTKAMQHCEGFTEGTVSELVCP